MYYPSQWEAPMHVERHMDGHKESHVHHRRAAEGVYVTFIHRFRKQILYWCGRNTNICGLKHLCIDLV